MRIITGKDYYDSALAYGLDEDIVFVREKNRIVEEKDFKFSPISFFVRPIEFEHDRERYYLRSAKIIFCGRFFSGFCVSNSYCSGRSDFKSMRFIWNRTILDGWLASIDLTHEAFVQKLGWNWIRRGNIDSEFIAATSPAEMDYLISERITIATYVYGCDWRINGDDLKSMEFIRLFDPVTAFQEIAMWVGGILPKAGPPIVEITDPEIKVAKHGFDKWSFRKQKAAR